MARKEKAQKQRKAGVSRLQRACALAGLLITLGVIGVLAREAFSVPAPAILTVKAEAARPAQAGWIVEVTVANQGDLTAAAVDIEGEAAGERATATLDYVPGQGRKKASLVFSTNERPEPKLRVLGWSEP
ncbi:hypothetical protein [Brevundimonas faecalis]|uniref:Uncharacterized protein (TIGR02588 family) n=1 Tax=Brevundimonas faecalis TaxID=947378 RepID=A0ABV2REY2_9CAUL